MNQLVSEIRENNAFLFHVLTSYWYVKVLSIASLLNVLIKQR